MKTIAVLLALLLPGLSVSADLVEVSVVTDRIIQLHIMDGRGIYSTLGKPVNEHVEQVPLDVKRAAKPASWTVSSSDDAGYRGGRKPSRVGRKSFPRDFATANQPQYHQEWTLDHRVFLVLPKPMKVGKTYTVSMKGLVTHASSTSFTWDPARTRSEAVRVNQLGYSPAAPKRYAYMAAWLGDLGPLSMKDYSKAWKFRVLDRATRKPVLEGNPALRRPLSNDPEGGQPGEGPHWRAEVWECDLAGLTAPGEYVLSVDGLGCSYPFRVDADAYRPAYVATMRGLYHQRCGTARTKPYTDYVRGVCHHPSIKPIYQSKRRYMEGHCDACKEVEATPEKREVWGGYHDAGDWDREGGHPEIGLPLAFAYELAPGKFADGEFNIPESGNGIPDILDEAKWAVDYYVRLQRPDGGVSVGLFLDSFPDPGESPDTDKGNWYIYAEDPEASYKHASTACHLAEALKLAGKPEMGADYVASARKAFSWAERNQRTGDADKVRDCRNHAAAALFRATGEKLYHDAFKESLMIKTASTGLFVHTSHDQHWGAWTYALTERPEVDPELKLRLRTATLNYAREMGLDPAGKRAARYGYNFWYPLSWGAGSIPRIFDQAVAHKFTGSVEYLTYQYTTCDFYLGCNPMNMCWITGMGSRAPDRLFHPDSWFSCPDGSDRIVTGLVPPGPHSYRGPGDPKSGPWDVQWVHSKFYPEAKEWPPMELYSDGHTVYPMNEEMSNTNSDAAASYGLLNADLK